MGLIDVTVKTLDSQNHRYSVPDDVSIVFFLLFNKCNECLSSLLEY